MCKISHILFIIYRFYWSETKSIFFLNPSFPCVNGQQKRRSLPNSMWLRSHMYDNHWCCRNCRRALMLIFFYYHNICIHICRNYHRTCLAPVWIEAVHGLWHEWTRADHIIWTGSKYDTYPWELTLSIVIPRLFPAHKTPKTIVVSNHSINSQTWILTWILSYIFCDQEKNKYWNGI